MTFPRTLFILVVLTASVLMYTHEEISKVILLYDIQGHQVALDHLDEARHLLTYQVSALASPPTLEGALARRELRLDLPEDRKVVRLAKHSPGIPSPKRTRGLWDFISITKVAQASPR